MASSLEDAEEDETGRDGGVEDTEENQRRDHEQEGDLLVQIVAERAERGCGVVLRAGVGIDDCANKTKDEDLGNGDDPQTFPELVRVLHFCDKAWECNLSNERVANVEEGVHPSDEGGPCYWHGKDRRRTTLFDTGLVDVVGVRVVVSRVCFDARKDCGEYNADEGEKRRCGCHLGKQVECAWQRAHECDHCHDGREANGTHLMIRHGVQIFGASQDVQGLRLSTGNDFVGY